jgi:radical SAM protein with 4Fe4S-binding SPASM domain
MVKVYSLEATNVCNMRCTFCPTLKPWARRPKGYMSLDLIDQIDWSATEYVELHLSGESTLHPKISEIARHVKRQGVYVGLSTNGSVPGVDWSVFDCVTVTKDIERAGDVVGDGHNVLRQELGVTWDYEDFDHDKPSLVDVSDCSTPHEYVSIHWDGDVVPCCKCHGKQHVFGNLFLQSWHEVMNGMKREMFLRDLNDNYICQYCYAPNAHPIQQKFIDVAIKSRLHRGESFHARHPDED